MRTIDELAVIPPTLRSTGAGGLANIANIERHSQGTDQEKKFGAHWNLEDVRGVLYANQWRVCGYCLRTLPGNDRGDVEHYRPKKGVSDDATHGGYWWQAYELSNYLLSCRICNASRKRSKFPIQNPESRATYENDPGALLEIPELFNPKRDDLDNWFTVDLSHRHAIVMPVQDLTPEQARAASDSLRFFRINTDQFLIRERIHILDKTVEAIEVGDIEKAKRLAVRYSPQSIVARQVLRESSPENMPDTEFEVSWLLDQIVDEFASLASILESDPTDNRSHAELKETKWVLAALLHSLPASNRPRISELTAEMGIAGEILELAGLLATP